MTLAGGTWEPSPGLAAALRLLDEDPELRARLIRDPKGTVLYVLPRLMGMAHREFTVDDELWLVGWAEFQADNGG